MADQMIYIPSASVGMTALTPQGFHFIPVCDMTLLPLNPTGVVGFSAEELATAKTIFRCYVTGSEDALDDLEIPISMFTARVREGDPSYLSCKVPCGSTYTEGIELRPNGDIIIKSGLRFADGSEYLEEIVRVNYETMATERTGTLDNLVITGHKTQTLGQSKEWPLAGMSYYSADQTGRRRLRGTIDFRLRCGDICIYGDETGENMIAGAITYTVTAKPPVTVMEIEEAE